MSQEKMPFIRELYEGFVKGAVPAALEQLDQSIELMSRELLLCDRKPHSVPQAC
jgi:hypothetical protein